MPSAKTVNLKRLTALLLFVAIFLLARIPDLGTDAVNPDAVNWHYRSEQFVVGLKHGLWEKTYQHYHPGVTLMWVTGIPVEIFKQLSGVEIYDQFSFYAFHFVAKYSLVLVQLILILLVIYWLAKIISAREAYAFGLLFSLEPFILGNSRLYHMDLLFTLLTFAALILAYLYMRRGKLIWLFLSAVFIAFSFLTRSIGIGLYLYIVGMLTLLTLLTERDVKKAAKSMLLVTAVFLLTTFIFFPALWQKPAFVMKDIFSEGERIGVRDGHSQIFLGQRTEDPGPLFYPLVILLKSSPFLLAGLVLYLVRIIPLLFNSGLNEFKMRLKERKIISLGLFAGIFYLGYFLVMTFPSKKLDRYMITLYPMFTLLAVYGYCQFYKKSKRPLFYVAGVLLFFLVAVILPNISYHPYQFVYSNPLFGSSSRANNIIGQKSFGMGIFAVKEHLQSNYGSQVEVGFIDTKPIKTIYPNSLVSDIRVNGVSDYDVMVLAINEEIPEKVRESEVEFIQDSAIYIHGLEYWRFYVKRN